MVFHVGHNKKMRGEKRERGEREGGKEEEKKREREDIANFK